MAAIGKIREKSWLLLIVVGGAMIAFILSMVYGNSGGGRVEDNIGIGTVNSIKIDQNQYTTFVKNAENGIAQQKLRQNPNQRPQLTDRDIQNAKRQAWTTIISQQLMQKEFKEDGLIVDDYELDNVLYGENGYTPNPNLSAQFKDSVTGKFAPDKLKQALDQLKNSTKKESMDRYKNIIDYVRETQLQDKYTTLLKTGVHSTNLEGKDDYLAQKTVKNIAYVYQSYTKIPKGVVKDPTDKEIQAYYEAHKNDKKYEQKAHRKVSYFSIAIQASAEDSTKLLAKLSQLKPRFKATDKDSLFVMHYSDSKHYADDSTSAARPISSIHPGPSYPDSLSNVMDSIKKGDVVGPYFSRSGATLAKVIGFFTEETATVRHILLKAKTPQEYEAAQKKADSLIAVIKEKHNFVAMVKKYSEDAPSVKNGGEYSQFTEGTMVKPFNDFSFNQPIGTIGTVKTKYGIHIVKVINHGPRRRPILAEVVKQVKPSQTTIAHFKSIANNYISDLFDKFENKTPAQQKAVFDTFAVKNGYSVQFVTLQDESPAASRFSDIAEGNILSLAYKGEPKVGDITSTPIHDRMQQRGQTRQRMIVGYLSEIVKKGAPSLDVVKNEMTAEVRKDKEAKYIMDQMAGAKDLSALAKKMKAQYKTEGITFSSDNVDIGREPKIIGVAFSGLADGQLSVPVKGENGAFVLKVLKTTEAPKTTDYSAETEQIEDKEQKRIQSQYANALRKSADVVDNRKLRQYNIR